MTKIIWDIEILMIVPYNTLVYYPDETDDEFYEERIFSEIRSVLAIDIDIIDWHNRCEQIGFGRKNLQKIELFYSNDERSYILLDNYEDPYDQLSLISLGVKTASELGIKVRELTRKLNDKSVYNINYSEGTNSIFKRYPIDEKTRKRYGDVQRSVYLEGKEIVKYTVDNKR